MQLRKQCKFDLGYKHYKLQGNQKMAALSMIMPMAARDGKKPTLVQVDTKLSITASLSQ